MIVILDVFLEMNDYLSTIPSRVDDVHRKTMTEFLFSTRRLRRACEIWENPNWKVGVKVFYDGERRWNFFMNILDPNTKTTFRCEMEFVPKPKGDKKKR